LDWVMVPRTGIEPVRRLSAKRRILSPLCLPISPSGPVSIEPVRSKQSLTCRWTSQGAEVYLHAIGLNRMSQGLLLVYTAHPLLLLMHALPEQFSLSSSVQQNIAGIAQLVERNLAKVEVASSSLVSRSIRVHSHPRRGSKAVMHRIANPCRSVRLRPAPPSPATAPLSLCADCVRKRHLRFVANFTTHPLETRLIALR
jgi:hypothetical protein